MPDAFVTLVPELSELALPVESRATCHDCHMVDKPGDPAGTVTFSPQVGCCTYHPRLPNFLVGRILREGGEGAERLKVQLREGQPDAWELGPPVGWLDEYQAGRQDRFGKSGFVRCPYLANPAEGGLHCTIWKDRGAVCRTWYCAHDQGPSGAAMWRSLKRVLLTAERLLARWAVSAGDPPRPGAEPEAWEAWYLRAADMVDAWDGEYLGNLADLERSRDGFLGTWSELAEDEVPEVLGACLTKWLVGDDRIVVYGYSAFDVARVPRSLWQFLSQLDGERPWGAAAAEAAFAEEHVLDLFRVGALEPPTSAHLDPVQGSRLRLKTPDGKWLTLEPDV
ncbi:MAG: hypothetical protein EP330_10310 [Deltaproteobacteria bacterium]|nr:MAG: hypothetical protein EP330_10310 [Deltaproteobacteria bacterium]